MAVSTLYADSTVSAGTWANPGNVWGAPNSVGATSTAIGSVGNWTLANIAGTTELDATSVTYGVRANFPSGTDARTMVLLVELLDGSNNVISSFTTSEIPKDSTWRDYTTSIGVAHLRADTAGYRIRVTHQVSGGGMSGTVSIGLDAAWATVTYELRQTTLTGVGNIASGQAFGTPAVSGGAITVSGTPATAYIGLAYSFVPTRTGGFAPFTWSVLTGSLPAGLSLNTSTGEVSGTPTTAGTANFTLRATGSAGSGTGDLATSITVSSFTVNDGFQVLSYVGNGDSSRTIAHNIDLTAGGIVHVMRDVGGGGSCTFSSADGSTVFQYRDTAQYFLSEVVSASTATFGNGTATFPATASLLNESGVTYYVYIFRKHPLICDVVRFTGNGTSNQTLAHNLGQAPGFMTMQGLGRGWMWFTGHAVGEFSEPSQWKSTSTYGAVWGTASPTATQFSVGANVGGNYNNINGQEHIALLFPASTSFLRSGNYFGNGTDDSEVLSPGWAPQAFFYLRAAVHCFDELSSNEGFVGNDRQRNLTGGGITGRDYINGTATGLKLRTTWGYNNNTQEYAYLLIRRGSTVPPPGEVYPPSIASTATLGTPTLSGGAVTVLANPPNAVVSTPYSFTATASGGDGTYTWSVVSGSLPPGISMTSGGVFSGTPDTLGNYPFTLRATDGLSVFDEKAVSIDVVVVDVAPLFDMLTWVGDGTDVRNIASTVDLSTGGLVSIAQDDLSGNVTGRLVAATAATIADPHSINPGRGAVGHNIEFTSGGLRLKKDIGGGGTTPFNTSGVTYWAWVLKDDSQVLDVVRYVGNAATTRSIAHSLGSIPAAALNMGYWHDATMADADFQVFERDGTSRTGGSPNGDYNDTNADASNFYVRYQSPGTQLNNDGSTYTHLLFAGSDSGTQVIKCGSYVGNGSAAGPSVAVGFPPQHVSVRAAVASTWAVALGRAGNKIAPAGGGVARAWGDTGGAGRANLTGSLVQATETGFDVKTASDFLNKSGETYYYLAVRDPAPTFVFTVAPTSIGSGEALGAPTVGRGPVSVAPGGIASSEALGTAAVLRGAVTVGPTGIASAAALGTPAIAPGAVAIAPVGVPSGEALGAALTVSQSGGTQFVSIEGIASTAAVGAPALALSVLPSGIGSTAALGTPALTAAATIAPGAIPSGEQVGAPAMSAVASIAAVGIPPAAAVGTPTVARGAVEVAPAGIAATAAVGAPAITAQATIAASGIPSSEAVPAPTVGAAAVTLAPEGIASGAAVGTPAVGTDGVTVAPEGIASSLQFGAAAVTSQTSIGPAGIASGEALGAPLLAVTVAPVGIAPAAAVGTPSLQAGGLTIGCPSIASTAAIGTPVVSAGAVAITPPGIASQEAFGTAALTASVNLQALGIPATSAFGVPLLAAGDVAITPAGIPGEETFGGVVVGGGTRLAPLIEAPREAAGEATGARGAGRTLRGERPDDTLTAYRELDLANEGTR